jgi:hypothetical protein
LAYPTSALGTNLLIFGLANGAQQTGSYIIDDSPPIQSLRSQSLLQPLFTANLGPSNITHNVTITINGTSTNGSSGAYMLSHILYFNVDFHMPPLQLNNDGRGSKKNYSNNNVNDAAIIGGVLGGVILLLVTGIVVYFLLKRRQSSQNAILQRRNLSAYPFTQGVLDFK